MQTTQATQTSPASSVYRLLPVYRSVYWICGGVWTSIALFFLFATWPWWSSSPSGLEFLTALITILGLLLGVFLISMAKRMRIVLSEQKIEYYGEWCHFQTTWDNIERIGSLGLGEALLLRQPVPAQGWLSRFVKSKTSFLLIGGFGQTWGDGPFAQDLKRYLPHLFASTGRR